MAGYRAWWAPALVTCGCATGEFGSANDVGKPPSFVSDTADTSEGTTSSTKGTGASSDTTGSSDSTDSGEVETSDSSSSSGSSTTPIAKGCGDGVRDVDEICDGTDLGDVDSCTDVNPTFAAGAVTCSAACEYDTTLCFSNPVTFCHTANQDIADASSTTDFISVPVAPGVTSITDLDVFIDIQHTWIGDLQIGVSHEGVVSTLFNLTCTSNQDIVATFDDDGNEFVCTMSGQSLAVRPVQLLGGFNDLAVAGMWTLQIQDTAQQDTGTLREWCVTIAWA